MMILSVAASSTFRVRAATSASQSRNCSDKSWTHSKFLSVACACLLVLLLNGCQKQPEQTAMPAFVDAYFDALFEWNPSTATSLGFHQYDSKIEDLSQPAIAGRI